MVKIKRKIYIPIFIIAISALLYFYNTQMPKILTMCPEDFPETDEGLKAKTDSMDKWINDFYNQNPGSSLSEMAKARFVFYTENNCNKTIQRYYEAKEGRADPEEMRMIQNTIKEEIDNQATKNLLEALKEDKQKQIYEKQ